MLHIQKLQQITLQDGDGRHLRYVLQLEDLMQNDPFLILADDRFAHNTFADHPHKGMQTVTYVVEGSLEHYDNATGGGGRLKEGDFQIMNAGSGIIHNENPDRGEEVRVLQLWVNLSSEHKKTPGSYQDLLKEHVPVKEIEGGRVAVYAGQVEDVTSPLALHTPFIYSVIDLEAGASYRFPIPANYNSYMYSLEGDSVIDGQTVRAFDTAHFDTATEDDFIEIQATTATQIALFSGLPIQEPVAARGPFVMNTDDELREAFRAYREGTFLGGKPYPH